MGAEQCVTSHNNVAWYQESGRPINQLATRKDSLFLLCASHPSGACFPLQNSLHIYYAKMLTFLTDWTTVGIFQLSDCFHSTKD